jgi:hypothetical protein
MMTGPVLRAGAWPVVVGGCGAAFTAAATVLLPICFALLAAAAVVLLAAALRGQALPWAATGLAVAIAVSVGGRGLPRGCPVFRDPGNDGLEASRTPPCGQPHPPRRPTPFCLGRPVRSVDGTYPD